MSLVKKIKFGVRQLMKEDVEIVVTSSTFSWHDVDLQTQWALFPKRAVNHELALLSIYQRLEK